MTQAAQLAVLAACIEADNRRRRSIPRYSERVTVRRDGVAGVLREQGAEARIGRLQDGPGSS